LSHSDALPIRDLSIDLSSESIMRGRSPEACTIATPSSTDKPALDETDMKNVIQKLKPNQGRIFIILIIFQNLLVMVEDQHA
jgi:hypothetical protein